jgi:hypothetical protein
MQPLDCYHDQNAMVLFLDSRARSCRSADGGKCAI